MLLARGADLDVAMLGGRTALGWYGLGNYDNGVSFKERFTLHYGKLLNLIRCA